MNKVLIYAQFFSDYKNYLNTVVGTTANDPRYRFVSIANWREHLCGRYGGKIIVLARDYGLWSDSEFFMHLDVVEAIELRNMEVCYYTRE